MLAISRSSFSGCQRSSWSARATNSASRGASRRARSKLWKNPRRGPALERTKRGSSSSNRSIAATVSGDESSSEITHTQLWLVCARSESSWRSSRSSGGSQVAMQIAIRGGSPSPATAPGPLAASAGSSSIEPAVRRSTAPPLRVARSSSSTVRARSARGRGRIAQKPLRKALGPRLSERSGRGIEWAIAGVGWPSRAISRRSSSCPSPLAQAPETNSTFSRSAVACDGSVVSMRVSMDRRLRRRGIA